MIYAILIHYYHVGTIYSSVRIIININNKSFSNRPTRTEQSSQDIITAIWTRVPMYFYDFFSFKIKSKAVFLWSPFRQIVVKLQIGSQQQQMILIFYFVWVCIIFLSACVRDINYILCFYVRYFITMSKTDRINRILGFSASLNRFLSV